MMRYIATHLESFCASFSIANDCVGDAYPAYAMEAIREHHKDRWGIFFLRDACGSLVMAHPGLGSPGRLWTYVWLSEYYVFPCQALQSPYREATVWKGKLSSVCLQTCLHATHLGCTDFVSLKDTPGVSGLSLFISQCQHVLSALSSCGTYLTMFFAVAEMWRRAE